MWATFHEIQRDKTDILSGCMWIWRYPSCQTNPIWFLKPILKVRVVFKTYVPTNNLYLTIKLCFIINHGNGDWYWGLYYPTSYGCVWTWRIQYLKVAVAILTGNIAIPVDFGPGLTQETTDGLVILGRSTQPSSIFEVSTKWLLLGDWVEQANVLSNIFPAM